MTKQARDHRRLFASGSSAALFRICSGFRVVPAIELESGHVFKNARGHPGGSIHFVDDVERVAVVRFRLLVFAFFIGNRS